VYTCTSKFPFRALVKDICSHTFSVLCPVETEAQEVPSKVQGIIYFRIYSESGDLTVKTEEEWLIVFCDCELVKEKGLK
jgi:hypothetical protein